MSIEVQPELDFTKKAITGGSSYKFQRIVAEEGSNLVCSTSGVTRATFIIPDVAMNLAKSDLTAVIAMSAVGEAKDQYLHAYSGGILHIENIALKTQGGNTLAEIRSVPNYSRMVMPYTTRLSRFKQKEPCDAKSTSAAAINSGMGDMFHRTGVLKTAAPSAIAGGVRVGQQRDYQGALMNSDIDYESVCENTNSGVITANPTGVAESNLYMRTRLSLGELVGTLFAMNKTMVWNQQLILEIDFSKSTKLFFRGTSATTLGGAATGTTAHSLENLYLYLAVEQNDTTAGALRERARSGIEMEIPAVVLKKVLTGGAGTNVNVFRFNLAHGKKLKRVYTALFNVNEDGVTTGCHGNEAAAVCTGIRTQFLGVYRQDYTMDVTNGEAYKHIKDLIEGSVVQSHAGWQHHFVWIDSFDAVKTVQSPEKDFYDAGIPISLDMDYTIETTVAFAKQMYQYAVVQKTLQIKDNIALVV